MGIHGLLQLKLKLIYDRRSVGQSDLVSGSHLELMTRYLFSVWRLRVFCCGAPSLKREWDCNLLVQLILGLARAATLGSKSCRNHDHTLLSFETPAAWRARSPYLYPPGTGWPSYTPGHWVPFCRGSFTFLYTPSIKLGLIMSVRNKDRLCGLVVRVLGYRSGGQVSIPGITRKKK
jgi:hypothetical protein